MKTDAVEHTTVGGLLRYLRQRAGCTLAECAEAAGVSGAYMSAVERGTRKPFSDARVEAILKYLGFGINAQIAELAKQDRATWARPEERERRAAVLKLKAAGDDIVNAGGVRRAAWDAAVAELERLGFL